MKELIIKVDDPGERIWDGSPKTFEIQELVRCIDCKHYNIIGCSEGFGWCKRYEIGHTDDWFCADGEAKRNEL